MATEPTSWEDALYEAEQHCFKKVCEILGLTAGVDAFISTNGGAVECAVFDIGFQQTGEVTGFPANTYHWRGVVELYSRDRRKIQRWIMRLLHDLPRGAVQSVSSDMNDETTVYCFRVAPETKGVDEITTTDLKYKKEEEGIPVFTTAVNFDIVFHAGQRVSA